MSRERIEPLTDAALDREIDTALGIDPSPDFLARLRTEVAQGAPGPARAASSWVAAAALAAGVMAAVTASMTWRTAPAVLESSRLGGHGAVPSPIAGQDARSIAADARHGIPASAASAHTPSRRTVGAHGVRPASTWKRDATPHEPEVLVARAESAALRQLLAAASAGRVKEIPLPEPEIDPETGTIRATEIAIAPIQLESIAVPDSDAGETR
jgi:hypothetical protein